MRLAVILFASVLLVAVAGDSARAQVAPAEEFVGPFPSWHQVQCTGGDDTAMLQAALTDLDGEHQRPVLFIKPGTCRITSTLTLSNKLYVTVLGADPATTKMLWAGPASGRMFSTDGVSYSRFGRLTWDGGGTAHVVYDLTYGSLFSSGNRHEDEWFINLERSGIAVRGGENGIGDAETTFKRCHFIGPYAVGILLRNFNTLDYWVDQDEFIGLDVGVGNHSDVEGGAGGFSVTRSIFRQNTYDMRIANTNFFSDRWNYSQGAYRHLVGEQIGNSAAPWTSQGNTLIDPQGSPSATQLYMGNVGPLLLLDNLVRMPGYVFGQNGLGGVAEGYSANPTGDVASLHNVFSANSDAQYGVPSAGRGHIGMDDVINAQIADPNPTLPPPPAASTRPVIEVQGQDIAGALAQAGNTSAIVHIPAGQYPVPSTLNVGPNVILTGDGNVATQLRTAGADPIVRVSGPSHAVLRDFSLFDSNRTVTGIEITNADQPGGLVHLEDWHGHRNWIGLDISSLGATKVQTWSSQQGSDQRKDSGSLSDPPYTNYRVDHATLDIIGGAGSGSDRMYDLHSGTLNALTVYYENDGGPTEILTGDGAFTSDAGRWSAAPVTFNTSAFAGSVTLSNMAVANQGAFTFGPNTFVQGLLFGWGTDPGCPTFAGTSYVYRFGRHNDGKGGTDLPACAAESTAGVSDQDQFERDHLASLRGIVPLVSGGRPSDVTDVSLIRMGEEFTRTGLRVSGSGTAPVPTNTPTAGPPAATSTPIPTRTLVPTQTPLPASTNTPVPAPTSTSVPGHTCEVRIRVDGTEQPDWHTEPFSFCATFMPTPTSTPTATSTPIPTSTPTSGTTATLPPSLVYSVRWDGYGSLSSTARGATASIPLSFTNTSNFTWCVTCGMPVQVGYYWQDSTGPRLTEGFGALPGNMAPGDSRTNYALQVVTPSTPGTYFLTIDMVRQGDTWFSYRGSPTITLQVTIT